MSGASSVPDLGIASTACVRLAIYRGLRLHIGVDWSAEDLAEVLTKRGYEVNAPTVMRWIAGSEENRRTPRADGLLLLFDILGTKFTSKVLSVIGQAARSLEPAATDPGMVVAKLSTGLSEFAIRGADGIYCHVDRGYLEAHADEMIEVLTPYSAKGQG